MSHPDPHALADRTPIQVGEVWENPTTREYARILELPYDNPERRVAAELIARAGARVVGEHRHPGLVECFTVLEGEAVSPCRRVLICPQRVIVTRVRVDVTPGERFGHMIETLFGLARLGYTNAKGMPDPLQLSLIVREFSDVIVFRSPPLVVQRALFGILAPIARLRGYRATYPQLSRTVLAPRPAAVSSSYQA